MVLCPGLSAYTTEKTLDSNTAYYQGESLNYVIYAPAGFKMILEEAGSDGYSCAFVPEDESFEDADIMIGVNFYKIRGLDFNDAITQDTLSVREHFGESVTIRPVDSVFAASGSAIPTFYINNQRLFLPNVMISYFNGTTEMIIFELVISESVPRFKAEEIYISVLERFKALPIRQLGAR